jgi:hypothetical protein
MSAGRIVAAVTALVGWLGLVLQLAIVIGQLGPASGTWRFLGYFTIISNIAVAAIATLVALGGKAGLAGPRARLAGLTAIITVGIVYSLLLRSMWNPRGLQKLADAALHDWSPMLFLLMWVLTPHGDLSRRDIKWAMLLPGLYLAYALGRGAIDGWYAYWFLNPASQTLAALSLSILGMLALFAIIAAIAVAVDRRIAEGSN